MREEEVKAALSDICNVQHVKRVICHLIENLCGKNCDSKTYFPFPSPARSQLLLIPHRATG